MWGGENMVWEQGLSYMQNDPFKIDRWLGHNNNLYSNKMTRMTTYISIEALEATKWDKDDHLLLLIHVSVLFFVVFRNF